MALGSTATGKIAILGKYVNEAGNEGRTVSEW